MGEEMINSGPRDGHAVGGSREGAFSDLVVVVFELLGGGLWFWLEGLSGPDGKSGCDCLHQAGRKGSCQGETPHPVDG